MGELTRRTVLGGLGATALLWSGGGVARADTPGHSGVRRWIESTATELAGVDPGLDDRDLRPLGPMIAGAAVIGLGEASHTTHTLFALKHRLVRFLLSHHGVRTVAWEEAWGSGVLVDRYLTDGAGDPREIAAQSSYNLQTEEFVEFLQWGRSVNRSLPPAEQLRFVGADVLQLRQLQFDELREYVAEVAPRHLAEVRRRLRLLRIREHPGAQIGWFQSLPEHAQQKVLTAADELDAIIDTLTGDARHVTRFEARLHALTLRGFYHAYSPRGEREDVRETYIVEILRRWRRQHRTRIAYNAANAHTIAVPRQDVSFPDPDLEPDEWVSTRRMAGGLLRRRLGRRYVSVGTSFHRGTILSGWQTGEVRAHPVPDPAPGFVDRVLGSATPSDHLLDLRGRVPPEVRAWLNQRGRQRVYGGAFYDAALDRDFFMEMDRWGSGYDALIHLGEVRAARPLAR